MDINDRLYVEIVPYEGPQAPVPHPVRDAGFDPERAYKVLGMYNASETSECLFVLANAERQMWFISQRHLRAWRLIDGDEFSLPLDRANNAHAEGQSARPDGRNGESGGHAASVPRSQTDQASVP